jgi:dipeptidyl aminopeptidase/acylaminoacyl peptidase
MNVVQWIIRRLLFLSAVMTGGCGGLLVDGGIFPLPTIHLVNPTPASVGVAYEEVTFPTVDGSPLYGWFIPADNARATVLLHHGALGNRSAYTSFYAMIHRLGYHVFIYDYRGFGESLTLATLDQILPDADAALDYLRTRTEGGTGKIVLMGISMGTMPAITQATQNPPACVGLVLEGVAQRQSHPLAFLALGIVPSPEAFSHVPPEIDPYTHIEKVTMPKLFFQSPSDDVTPWNGTFEVFDKAIQPKRLVEVIGAHVNAVNIDPNYERQLDLFLSEVTADQSSASTP